MPTQTITLSCRDAIHINNQPVEMMKLKSFSEIPTKVVAEVRNGSLINLDERLAAEKAIGRELDWKEVENSRHTAGSYFQSCFVTTLPNHEAKAARESIIKYRENFSV